MKRILPLSIFLSLFVLQGCVYFNSFYNTKKAYKEALEENKRRKTDQPSSGEIQKLDKTIEKASKILQLYPNSKYVDDALLMLGECFFYKQEYIKALRKFDELITIFPKSELVSKANLWKVRSYIELNDHENAEQGILTIQTLQNKGSIFYEAQYHLAEIYYRQDEYDKAIELFEQSARKVSDDNISTAAYMRLGECALRLEQFDLAANAFKKANGQSKTRELKFDTGLFYARALKAGQYYGKALEKLNKMANEFSTYSDVPWVKYEIADCYLLRGESDYAQELLEKIGTEHKRTEASAAAQFSLGEFHQFEVRDYQKAREYYEKVRGENARSEYVDSAQRHIEAIDDYFKIQKSLVLMELQESSNSRIQIDSLAQASQDENRSKKKYASIRRLPIQKLEVSHDLENKDNDFALSKIQLAELYYDEFDAPDSALHVLNDVLEKLSHTEAAPQAMYALSFFIQKYDIGAETLADSLLRMLGTRHPSSPHGRAARRRLNMPEIPEQSSDTTEAMFAQAESLWMEDDKPLQAIQRYYDFVNTQTESELLPKSLYAIGWIYENELVENDSAYAVYKQLVTDYPNSSYSQKVLKKIKGFENPITEEVKTIADTAANELSNPDESLQKKIDETIDDGISKDRAAEFLKEAVQELKEEENDDDFEDDSDEDDEEYGDDEDE